MWFTKHTARVVSRLLVGGFLASPNIHAVTLAWDPSASAGVNGYRLYWGAASRSYTNFVDVGNVTSGSVSNLSTGGPYFFSITAYNTLNVESDFGDEITY